MKRLLSDAKIGDLFIRRDGKICIYLGKDIVNTLYKYRFRLLDEHNKWCNEIKCLLDNNYYDTINKYERLYKSNDYPQADWNVKCSGYATACSKWKSNIDIIKPYNNN